MLLKDLLRVIYCQSEIKVYLRSNSDELVLIGKVWEVEYSSYDCLNYPVLYCCPVEYGLTEIILDA